MRASRVGLMTAFALIALVGCSGGHSPVAPESGSNHTVMVAQIVAKSPARFIDRITLDGEPITAKGYIYLGTRPGSTRTFEIHPAPGAQLTASWSTTEGRFGSAPNASGLKVNWTTTAGERGEGRVRVEITTPDGRFVRLFRMYVDSHPPKTDYVLPAPLKDVDLFDPNPPAESASTYKVALDELLVMFTKEFDGDASDREALIGGLGCQIISQVHGQPIYDLYNAEGGDLWAKIKRFRALPFVKIAEPNCMRYIDSTPNDPDYNLQYCHPLQKDDQAWDVGTGDANQAIAIMDTGVGGYHPDLAAKCIDGMDFITPQGLGNGWDCLGNGIDDDGNGGIDDTMGHGVHCSGISAGIANNSEGGCGLAWQTKLMGLKIFPANGDGGASSSDIDNAIQYIADYNNNPANTIKIVACNMSFGGGGASGTEQTLFDNALASGCTFAAAAGNANTNQKSYPGAYDNLIGVAATDDTDTRAGFSNYGTWVDVAACGVNIYNTYFHGAPPTTPQEACTYAYLSGTSMATPQVTGLIALVKANAPSLTPADIRLQIMGTTDNIDAKNPGYVGQLGTGRINAFRALTQGFSVDLSADGTFTIDESQVGFAGGNRDGKINPGEKVLLTPKITNAGLKGAANFVAQITTPPDQYIKFAKDSITIDSITRSGMTASEGFPMVVLPSTPDGYEKQFDYTVTDPTNTDGPWSFSFTVYVDKDNPSADTVNGVSTDLTNGIVFRPLAMQPFFSVDLPGDQNYLTLKKLTVSLLGTVSPSAITNVRLWEDTGNGTFDGPAADTQLGLTSYWNTSYTTNFDRQSDPSSGLGSPRDRNVYGGASIASGTVSFRDIRVPVIKGNTVRLFVSADVGLSANGGDTVGLAVQSASDVQVSAGDTLTGFPWGTAVVPIQASWNTEGIFAQIGSDFNWRAKSAMDDQGHIYVVYDSCCWSDFDLYMRKSDNAGQTWSDETPIQQDPGNDFYPDVAIGPNREVYVSWYSTLVSNNNREIYFQSSTDFGGTWSPEIRVTNSAGNGRVPRISASGNSINLVWFDEKNTPNDYKVYYKQSTDGGNNWSADELVSNTPAGYVAEEPQITTAGSTLYCAWYEYQGTFPDPGANYRVVYNFKPAAGVWATPRVLTQPTEQALGVKITPDPNGKCYAVYASDADGDQDIYLQVLNNGATDSTEQITNDTGNSTFPDITRDPATGRTDIVYQNSVDGVISNIYHTYRLTDTDPWGYITALSQNTAGQSDTPYLLRDNATGNMWCWWNDTRPAGEMTWFNSLVN